MSWQATAWVSRIEAGGPSGKLLLYALANYADEHGRCYPGDDRIMRDTELSERSVRDWKRRLEEAGLISISRRRKPGGDFDLDIIQLAMADAQPPAKSAGGATGKSCRDHRQMTPPPPANAAVPPTPPYMEEPPVEPSEEPEERGREREAASEDQPTGDDPRRFERRVKKLAETHHWPNWSNSSTSWTVKRFAELTDAERAEAESRAGAYIATCGRKALALGTYFHERKWRDLPADAIAKHEAPQPLKAAPFGKLFGAFRLSLLMQEPQTQHVKLTGFEQSLIRDGKASMDQLMREKRMKFGWPRVSGSGGLDEQATRHVSVTVPPAIAPLVDLMEPVRVGTERWEEWKLEHQLKGWPWVPDPGAQEWVYFPMGGPSRLQEFEQAVKGEGNVDRYDHAAE